jgi:hypothetical protein
LKMPSCLLNCWLALSSRRWVQTDNGCNGGCKHKQISNKIGPECAWVS